MEKVLFNWSGGKDSSLCLYRLLQDDEYEVCRLFTSVNEVKGRVSMHGTREKLLRNQVENLGLPLDCLMLHDQINMDEYNQKMREELQSYLEYGINNCAFGDIFLDDLRAYREERLSEINIKALFPLWKQPTNQLAREFIDLGFKAVISSVDGSKLYRSFVGREYDQQFLEDLPTDVDLCGEYGEFHTFVYDGPIFDHPVSFTKGEIVQKIYENRQDQNHSFTESKQSNSFTYWFIDLIPA